MMKRAITLSAGLLIFSGCGVPNTLTLEEAKEAAAASDFQMRASTSATSSGSLANQVFTFNQTVNRSCPEGGEVETTISIGGNLTDLTSQSGSVNIDYSMSMSSCVANEVTMDGNMKLTMTTSFSTSSTGSSVSMELAVSGGLYFDGSRIQGSCSFDYSCTMSTSTGTTAGATTATSIYVSCTGDYCGHDIDEVFEGNLIPISD